MATEAVRGREEGGGEALGAAAAALLARQQDSGLNVEAFCAREGVHPTSLYGWRRRLGFCGRREEDSRPEMSVVPAGAPGFVELVPAALPCLSSGLRLRLPGRVVVEVDRGFDRDTLASALAVVLESR